MELTYARARCAPAEHPTCCWALRLSRIARGYHGEQLHCTDCVFLCLKCAASCSAQKISPGMCGTVHR
jgi:hypothetical protein